jgi:hypothetical protein
MNVLQCINQHKQDIDRSHQSRVVFSTSTISKFTTKPLAADTANDQSRLGIAEKFLDPSVHGFSSI